MVEPVSVGVIVAALLARALNRAEDGVIDHGVEAARKAVEALRRRFALAEDIEAGQALEGLVQAPDSKRREEALAGLLEERGAESDALREELEAIVGQMGGTEVQIGNIRQVAQGEDIVQNAGNVNSEINVTQGSSRPRD